MKREEIEQMVKKVLVEDFELEEAKLVPEVNLFTELDLDSIDAVDLVVRLQQETGKKVDPAAFRQIRTLEDVINAIEKLLSEG